MGSPEQPPDAMETDAASSSQPAVVVPVDPNQASPEYRYVPRSTAAVLRDHPYSFEFFQAVRVLARLFGERTGVGYDGNVRNEIARFRAHMSLRFPASEIQAIKFWKEDEKPSEVFVNFMGLTGPSGVLPTHYTELLIVRSLRKDRTLAEFLDLFNHRLISLFYRAWEKYRFFIGYENAAIVGWKRAAAGPEHYRSFVIQERATIDLFAQSLLDLAGHGTPALRYRTRVRSRLERRQQTDDETLRFYAGLFSQRHRSAIGLETMLEDFFGVPVTVRQFTGQWLLLRPGDQTRLSRHQGNCQLGVSAVAGERVWEVQGKFRVTLGPLSYEQFRDFLPTGTAHQPLADLIRLYAGMHLDLEIELLLRGEEVPFCRLGSDGRGSLLGWETWNRARPFSDDVASIIFSVRGG